MAKRMGGMRKPKERKESAADMRMDKRMGIKEGSARDEKLDARGMKKKGKKKSRGK